MIKDHNLFLNVLHFNMVTVKALSDFRDFPLSYIRSVVSDFLRPHGLSGSIRLTIRQSIRLLCPWDFPGKSARVDCHFLLQGIFPTEESNPGLLH